MAELLRQEEADELLKMLKRCVDASIALPSCGFRKDYDVFAIEQKNEKFIVSINRKCSFVDKVSYVARYRKDNTLLLRLDVAPTASHKNPPELGGEIIDGTHLHLYREGFEVKYAIPFDVKDINLEKNFFEFLDQFNVIDRPSIIQEMGVN